MEDAAEQKAAGPKKKLQGGEAKPLPVLSRKSFISQTLQVTESERKLIQRAYGNLSPSPSPSGSLSDADSSPNLTPKSAQSLPSQGSPGNWKDSLRGETHGRNSKPSVTSKSPKFASMTPVLQLSPQGLKKVADFPEVKRKLAARSARTFYQTPRTPPTPPAGKSSPKKTVGTSPGTKTPNRAFGKKARGGSQSPVGSSGRGRSNWSSIPPGRKAVSVGSVSPQSSLSDVTMTSEETRGPVLEPEASFSSAEGTSMAEIQGLLSESEAVRSSSEFADLVMGRGVQLGSEQNALVGRKEGLVDSRGVGKSQGLVMEQGGQTDGGESVPPGKREGLYGNGELDPLEEAPPAGVDSTDGLAGNQPAMSSEEQRAGSECKKDETVGSASTTNVREVVNTTERSGRPPTRKLSSEGQPAARRPGSSADVASDVTFQTPSRSEGSPSSGLRLLHVTDCGVTVEDQSSGLSPETLQRTARDLVGAGLPAKTFGASLWGGGIQGGNDPPEDGGHEAEGTLPESSNRAQKVAHSLRGGDSNSGAAPLEKVWRLLRKSRSVPRLNAHPAERAARSDISSCPADVSGAGAEGASFRGQSLRAGDLQQLRKDPPNTRLDSARMSLSPSRFGQLAQAAAEAEVLRGPEGGVVIGSDQAVLRSTKSDTATMMSDRRHSFEDELEMGGWRGMGSERPEVAADVAADVAEDSCGDVARDGAGFRTGGAGLDGSFDRVESTGHRLSRGMGLRVPSRLGMDVGRIDYGNRPGVDDEVGAGAETGSGEVGAAGGVNDAEEGGGEAREDSEGLADVGADALDDDLRAEPDGRETAGELQLEDVLKYKAQMKQRFARLLLGNDLSGGSLGVSPALAVSNAIKDLATTVFGDVCALEPLMNETRLLWTREIEWLIAPACHVVEMRPGWIVTPEGKKTEVMQRMPRGDIQASLPVLRKLDGLVLDTLDTLVDHEFSYVSKRRRGTSEADTWWRPKAGVPTGGLSGEGLRKLRGQKEVVMNVYAVATAINAQTLEEIEIPEEYWESLPKSSKAALGDDLYRALTDEVFDLDATVTALTTNNEQAAANIASALEAAVHLWQRKIDKRAQDEPGNTSLRVRMESMAGHGAEQRERWAQRASALLLSVLATCPMRPRTRLTEFKVRYNKDVGRAVLESYSRVLGSVASDLLAGFTHVLELHEEAYSLRKALRASLEYQDFQDSPTSMLVNPAPTPPGGSRRGSSSAGEDLERDVFAKGGKSGPARNPLQQWVVLEGRSARSPQSPARFADHVLG